MTTITSFPPLPDPSYPPPIIRVDRITKGWQRRGYEARFYLGRQSLHNDEFGSVYADKPRRGRHRKP